MTRQKPYVYTNTVDFTLDGETYAVEFSYCAGEMEVKAIAKETEEGWAEAPDSPEMQEAATEAAWRDVEGAIDYQRYGW